MYASSPIVPDGKRQQDTGFNVHSYQVQPGHYVWYRLLLMMLGSLMGAVVPLGLLELRVF